MASKVSPSHYSDLAVQSTCDDAASCKRFAVQRGYWNDKYISHMVQGSSQKRQPEINRGYYARTEKIWQVVTRFIEMTRQQCQVVSLGAGLDTTFWRLSDANLVPTRYVEVDFKEIVSRKMRQISNRPALKNCLGPFMAPAQDANELHSENYHLVCADLRDIDLLEAKLKSCGLDFRVPTLFIAECVLVYVPSEKSQTILEWISNNFTDAMFVNYEQVNMKDNFGQVMITNLKARDCLLAGVDTCESVEVQESRFLTAGWQTAVCKDMWTIYNGLSNKTVIERIELLDECELLQQLMEHYCICIAVKDSTDVGLTSLIT